MRHSVRWLLVCALSLLVASVCAAEPKCEALVELRVAARTAAGAEIKVTSATPLRKGDRLVLDLLPRRAAFIYVIHLAPNGSAQLLYSTDKRVPAREKIRLPLKGEGAYELDDEAGQETLAVIASETAFAAGDTYAAIIESVQRQGRLPAGVVLQDTPAAKPSSARAMAATAGEPSALDAATVPSTPGAAARSTLPAVGYQDLEGSMRGLGGAPVLAIPGPNGVALVTFPIHHVR